MMTIQHDYEYNDKHVYPSIHRISANLFEYIFSETSSFNLDDNNLTAFEIWRLEMITYKLELNRQTTDYDKEVFYPFSNFNEQSPLSG